MSQTNAGAREVASPLQDQGVGDSPVRNKSRAERHSQCSTAPKTARIDSKISGAGGQIWRSWFCDRFGTEENEAVEYIRGGARACFSSRLAVQTVPEMGPNSRPQLATAKLFSGRHFDQENPGNGALTRNCHNLVLSRFQGSKLECSVLGVWCPPEVEDALVHMPVRVSGGPARLSDAEGRVGSVCGSVGLVDSRGIESNLVFSIESANG